DLPRGFSGDFRWDASGIAQPVEIRFTNVRQVWEHAFEAIGCGRYDVSGVITDIRVRMLIAEANLAVELFELEPVGSAGFVVDGSHVGTLSDDLRHLVAVWTTRTSGQSGRLDLRAGGSLRCSGAVAQIR